MTPIGDPTAVSQLTQGVPNTVMGLFLRRDGTSPPNADLSLGNHSLTQLAPPMGPWDAATK